MCRKESLCTTLKFAMLQRLTAFDKRAQPQPQPRPRPLRHGLVPLWRGHWSSLIGFPSLSLVMLTKNSSAMQYNCSTTQYVTQNTFVSPIWVLPTVPYCSGVSCFLYSVLRLRAYLRKIYYTIVYTSWEPERVFFVILMLHEISHPIHYLHT